MWDFLALRAIYRKYILIGASWDRWWDKLIAISPFYNVARLL